MTELSAYSQYDLRHGVIIGKHPVGNGSVRLSFKPDEHTGFDARDGVNAMWADELLKDTEENRAKINQILELEQKIEVLTEKAEKLRKSLVHFKSADEVRPS